MLMCVSLEYYYKTHARHMLIILVTYATVHMHSPVAAQSTPASEL